MLVSLASCLWMTGRTRRRCGSTVGSTPESGSLMLFACGSCAMWVPLIWAQSVALLSMLSHVSWDVYVGKLRDEVSLYLSRKYPNFLETACFHQDSFQWRGHQNTPFYRSRCQLTMKTRTSLASWTTWTSTSCRSWTLMDTITRGQQ